MGVFVRDGYLESKRIAKLASNPKAEVFYFHLLLAVDEKGEIEYDKILLRNRCFPALDCISTDEIECWVNACGNAGLIQVESFLNGKVKIVVLRHGNNGKAKKAVADETESCLPFETFWNMYDKKVERKKCEQKYSSINESDREIILEKLPEYIQSTPNPAFRKHPLTWLNGACWNDEIMPIMNSNQSNTAFERRK
jgi:hypothetical protein